MIFTCVYCVGIWLFGAWYVHVCTQRVRLRTSPDRFRIFFHVQIIAAQHMAIVTHWILPHERRNRPIAQIFPLRHLRHRSCFSMLWMWRTMTWDVRRFEIEDYFVSIQYINNQAVLCLRFSTELFPCFGVDIFIGCVIILCFYSVSISVREANRVVL